jgi:hypothetical protein
MGTARLASFRGEVRILGAAGGKLFLWKEYATDGSDLLALRVPCGDSSLSAFDKAICEVGRLSKETSCSTTGPSLRIPRRRINAVRADLRRARRRSGQSAAHFVERADRALRRLETRVTRPSWRRKLGEACASGITERIGMRRELVRELMPSSP